MKTIEIRLSVIFQIPDEADERKAVNEFWEQDQYQNLYKYAYTVDPIEDGDFCNGQPIRW